MQLLVLKVLQVKWGDAWGLTFFRVWWDNPLILCMSLSIFMLFSTLNLGVVTWMNKLASATFGVYLIHDYRMSRVFLWKDVFSNGMFLNSWLFVPYSLGVALLIYSVCTGVERLRQRTRAAGFFRLLPKANARRSGTGAAGMYAT